jgi:hypothetical protein
MKQKNYLPLLVLLLICACKKDIFGGNDHFDTTLALSPEALKMVPDTYQTGKAVVFINELGQEKRFIITQYNGVDSFRYHRPQAGLPPYVREQKFFELKQAGVESLALAVTLGGSYNKERKPYFYLSCYLRKNNTFVTTSVSDKPGVFGDRNKLEEWTMHGKVFTGVYKAFDLYEQEPYDALFYTKKDGIVGFGSTKGTIWVLDRVE